MDNSLPPSSTPPPFTPPPPNASPGAGRNWEMWCHMSALAGLIFPALGALLAPLIVWQMKRHEYAGVDYHGKEAFNFQLSMFLYSVLASVAALVGTFFCFGVVLWILPVIIHYGAIVFGVIAGIKANEGVAYRYPFNLRFVR